MKKLLATLIIGIALALPATVVSTGVAAAAGPTHSVSASITHADPASIAAGGKTGGKTCPAYSQNCVVIPPNGNITFTCAGITITGTATPGTTITCNQIPLLVQLACSSESAVSFSISGTNLHLTTPGRLFWFNPATGQSTAVSAITGSGGQFTVVFGSCAATSPILPTTGGGGGHPLGPNMPYLPFGLGLALVLVGAAVTLRTRFTQV
jgi:hypothetical protein